MKRSEIIPISLDYRQDIREYLREHYPQASGIKILKKSLDARGAPRGRPPHYHYQVELFFNKPVEASSAEFPDLSNKNLRPIIVGMGPAGLFCALRLLEYGIKPIVIERGPRAQIRMKDIARFWRYGVLNPDSNVCFGEGGAGLYSDGKLITRVKSPYIQYVLEQLVHLGAPEEILYHTAPHVGSNRIRSLINGLSALLEERGATLLYDTKIVDLVVKKGCVQGVITHKSEVIEGTSVVLAIGHSSTALFRTLKRHEVALKRKDFAIGLRVEHPRRFIDRVQWGDFSGDPELGSAFYRLSYHDHSLDQGNYSFCMCPGGYVLSSGTEIDGLVTNGMSNSGKNSPWSNAALVSTVKGDEFKGSDPLAGFEYIEQIEKKAFQISTELASGRELPAMSLRDFYEGKLRQKKFKSSSPSKVAAYNLLDLLPEKITTSLRKALEVFDQQMPGFLHADALAIAPETRTSSPATIIRDPETLESISHQGLYPCGEGAGYAGGITSAAVDGIKVAESLKGTMTFPV